MEIDFNKLEVGTVLERNIIGKDGTLVLSKGTKITSENLQRLRNFRSRISYDGEEPQKSLTVVEEVKETVDETFRKEIEGNIDEFMSHPTETQAKKIKEDARMIVEKTQRGGEPQFDLEDYLSTKNDTTSHAVRVACFSILLAQFYNDTVQDKDNSALVNLNDIATAALLQDVGSIYKDPKKLGELTEVPKSKGMEELFPGIKETPLDYYDENYSSIYSFSAVAKLDSISNSAKLMILLAGETEKGDGPLKMPEVISRKRNGILYGAKIIRVCSIYDDAMKHAIQSDTSLEDVVSEIGQYAINGDISEEIKELLINKVKLYPHNTRVLLSNGQIATVEECRVGHYDSYKPVVCTCGIPRKRIDLKESITTTIKSIVSKERFNGILEQQIAHMKDEATGR